ncbi:Alpha/Beta hydrolase protein [Lineolata rhizophorae]|uniref:Alpha/Beta hydrolase protein n=1 Tax=Lineolata rhizophorae TaxID=578093 RepID=A0A6A6NWW1_9PEZI|nr:Alpha/Beta hydrolase protein [Lineolata rhizophorae]
MPPPPPMTVDEVKRHPEFPHVFWNLPPREKGKLAVGQGRGGPFHIAYEVHGQGPRKMIWIMGMGSLKSQWQRQTKDFSHSQADRYTCLVLDNRGIGESDKPLLRYSTSEMARDVLEVVDHVGWASKRELNVVGISLGGMIGQELPFIENLRNRINLFIPRSLDVQVANVKRWMYTDKWISAPDDAEPVVEPFPTNGDRFTAMEVQKRSDPNSLTRVGFVAQAIAAGWHHKSEAQIKQLGDRVGRERIMVAHGTLDRMITVPHAHKMVEALKGEGEGYGELTVKIVEGMAHVMPVEIRKEFNGWVEEMVGKGEAANTREGV